MFKNLIQFWKGKDFLSRVLEEFKGMLDDSKTMFISVCERLIDNKEVPGLKSKIYEIDRKVNALQKDIRKKVVEHLSVQPSVDVPTCLLLMSVVKDAERLGDYCKNLYEVTTLLAQPMDAQKYKSLFDGIDKEIIELFGETTKAFIESDENIAAKSWSYKDKINKRCDEIVSVLAKGDLPTNEAVCFTLIARYYKRLSSHLINIATSVILPITDLDYFDEKRKM